MPRNLQAEKVSKAVKEFCTVLALQAKEQHHTAWKRHTSKYLQGAKELQAVILLAANGLLEIFEAHIARLYPHFIPKILQAPQKL